MNLSVRRLLRATALGVLAALAARCGSSVAPTPVPAPVVTVTSLSISGLGASGTAGDVVSLKATAALSNQTTEDVTTAAAWESSNTAIATVTSSAQLTMVAAGECDVRSVYKGVTGTTHFSVSPKALSLGTLAGLVTDTDSGRAVVGGRVEVLTGSDKGRFSPTDGNGYYSIGGIVAGSFTVRVTRDGYSQSDVVTNLEGVTRFDIKLRSLPPPPYVGNYNVSLSVTQDTCKDIVPATSGQVQFSGSATSSAITVRVVERGITRSYNGSIGGDGTFSAGNSSASTSGSAWLPSHDYSGIVSGRVNGNLVSGSERLTFTSGCPGQVLVIGFSGSK